MARPKTGSNLSIAQLESILSSRLADLQRLNKEHTKLSNQLAEVERKIAALGGKARGRGRPAGGRVRNEKSLVQTLEMVLSASTVPMRVGDIVDGVLKAGYHTVSENFRGIVNQTLIKERRRFASTGRGMYTTKGKK
jgi:hypothetical protein